ncbi:MAG: cation diffusion facilitator family transporter [Hyphomonadaceae bacterium]
MRVYPPMHAHDHSHGHLQGRAHHAHHHPRPPLHSQRYSIALALNLAFVAAEAAAGFFSNSTALLSDAAHNLSDVLGLALAGGAAWLAARAPSTQRTYGFGKATVLAALANALILVAASGAIGWEAARRLAAPETIEPLLVMAVAGVGVLVNGATALLFLRDQAHDINARGAFLHMAADAAVSFAVIAAGFLIWRTGAAWIDPALSLIVVAVILWSTWGLLKDSLNMALDAAPANIDVAAVRAHLESLEGVSAVHDLHVWAMSASELSLTAHLVRAGGGDDDFLHAATQSIAHRFGIEHVTLQIERARRDECGEHV